MKIIYKNPMNTFQIRDITNFFNETEYFICKYDGSDYLILYHCSTLKKAYKWLLDHKIISKDESNHQTESL